MGDIREGQRGAQVASPAQRVIAEQTPTQSAVFVVLPVDHGIVVEVVVGIDVGAPHVDAEARLEIAAAPGGLAHPGAAGQGTDEALLERIPPQARLGRVRLGRHAALGVIAGSGQGRPGAGLGHASHREEAIHRLHVRVQPQVAVLRVALARRGVGIESMREREAIAAPEPGPGAQGPGARAGGLVAADHSGAPGPGVVDSRIQEQGCRRGVGPLAARDVHFEGAGQRIGSRQESGKPPVQGDVARCGERHHGEVRAGVPAQSNRHAIHEHGDLPVLAAAQRRLGLAAGIGADDDERHLARHLFQRRGGRHAG